MSRIEWNKAGERFFETGVNQTVLYPRVGPGVPWNGVTDIAEASSGGEVESLYFEGVKYLDIIAAEDFQATLAAYTSPAEFGPSDGQKQLSPGLFATQQRRVPFGLSYRTLIGNDLKGEGYGYKLHLVYNCTAAPSARSYKTLGAGPVTPDTRSWAIYTVPPASSSFRPTAHLVIDSTLVDPYLMEDLETQLYGRDAASGVSAITPYLPTVGEIVSILSNPITQFIEATV